MIRTEAGLEKIRMYTFMITNYWTEIWKVGGDIEFKKKIDIYNHIEDFHNISRIGFDENYIYYHFSKYKMSNICIEKNIPTKHAIEKTDVYREEYTKVWNFLKQSRPVWMTEQTFTDMVMAGFKS